MPQQPFEGELALPHLPVGTCRSQGGQDDVVDRVRPDVEAHPIGGDNLRGGHEAGRAHPPRNDEVGRRKSVGEENGRGLGEEVGVTVVEGQHDRPRREPGVIGDRDDSLVQRDDMKAVIGEVLHLHLEHRRGRREAVANPVKRIRIDPNVVVQQDRHVRHGPSRLRRYLRREQRQRLGSWGGRRRRAKQPERNEPGRLPRTLDLHGEHPGGGRRPCHLVRDSGTRERCGDKASERNDNGARRMPPRDAHPFGKYNGAKKVWFRAG